MDGLDIVILLLHPVVATAFIIWILNKRSRKRFVTSHSEISHGNNGKSVSRSRIFVISWALVISGFVANFIFNYRNGNTDIVSILIPAGVGSLHSIGGLLGIFLLTLITIRKRRSSTHHNHEIKDANNKNKSGQLSQNLVTIVIIGHAFLGFIWLIELIST
ncbi:MAG: hypothetical protein CMB54_06740 [Euryarchaeota archaeon]|nr:hypothetical protein [Euryarchaeota archaeon]|tara:strand:+ start:3798 stop:4280 length:483 start_codon:yes stop_codon:yes gene_type:complete